MHLHSGAQPFIVAFAALRASGVASTGVFCIRDIFLMKTRLRARLTILKLGPSGSSLKYPAGQQI